MNKKKNNSENTQRSENAMHLADKKLDTKLTIAGIYLETHFCNKLNEQPIGMKYISAEPIVNIYKGNNKKSLIVNVVSYIPVDLKPLTETPLNSGLFLNDDHSLFLNYSGVSNILTEVDNGNMLCRVFNIVYDNESWTTNDKYDAYHIQFEYKLLSNNFQSVEGIVVHDINIDPETDRGTVSTVRVDDR